MILTPKNWKSFQHYKDRSPAWIKLHRGLLNDYDFYCLPVASRALAPILWLLASEYEDGKITGSLDALAFKLHMSRGDFSEALSPLIESGFFDASEPLADCKRDACPEKREEEENIDKRERRETREVALSFGPHEFVSFWAEWPNKVGKPAALKALASARKRGVPFEAIMDGVRRYVRTKPPDRAWMNPATFLNGNRWEDEPAAVARLGTVHQQERETGREILNALRDASSRENPEFLRHDTGNGPESLRGGVRGALVELSAACDREGHEPVQGARIISQLSQPGKVSGAS